ncbi:efflux RND transporter periplasmic adaptor subunit [Methylocystis sp. H4A]|uniref:efflux RND transporter periplasmic adaptor subunit n=2 Tax=Methylocystis TaxID=133 RepID=UPI0018C2BC6F|nr:efflux RND transporter periplasmic adaptor subunit [Methylocystis sp. H4A]MBG0801414.1 efflux RND transporter periplasmic adaptor subunit [Methylocystis sp. H4A]MBG0802088.1 efflux RND transporter periplasmic adaptor subunit [Methylocystis sp. H4A]
MTRYRSVLVLAVLASLALGAALPSLFSALRSRIAPDRQSEAIQPGPADGEVRLSAAQIEASKIATATVGPGVVTRRITAPAAIKPDPDKIARVAAKVAGVVEEMRKRLGDQVARGETIAIIDSREVAEAKSEYLAALANFDLQNVLFQREKGLFEKKITAEQLFLKAKAVFMEAKVKLDLARQKLAALDMSEQEIAALPSQPIADLRRKEIRAPISGRVIERLVSVGQPVGGEGQAKELYVISDLSVVEAELAVPAADLALLREGQEVRISNAEGRAFEGKITYVNAMITRETRSGQILVRFPNPDFSLRPGSLVEAEISLKEARVKLKIPRSAVMVIDGKPNVFVRTPEGFTKRDVELGRGDDNSIEVVSGLQQGEQIAVSNVFLLKAELGKQSIPEE